MERITSLLCGEPLQSVCDGGSCARRRWALHFSVIARRAVYCLFTQGLTPPMLRTLMEEAVDGENVNTTALFRIIQEAQRRHRVAYRSQGPDGTSMVVDSTQLAALACATLSRLQTHPGRKERLASRARAFHPLSTGQVTCSRERFAVVGGWGFEPVAGWVSGRCSNLGRCPA